MVETPVLQREALVAGRDIEGPLIIEERASTTVVQPGDRLRADASGSLIIEIGKS
jgi:N-methylhydantoinase A